MSVAHHTLCIYLAQVLLLCYNVLLFYGHLKYNCFDKIFGNFFEKKTNTLRHLTQAVVSFSHHSYSTRDKTFSLRSFSFSLILCLKAASLFQQTGLLQATIQDFCFFLHLTAQKRLEGNEPVNTPKEVNFPKQHGNGDQNQIKSFSKQGSKLMRIHEDCQRLAVMDFNQKLGRHCTDRRYYKPLVMYK